MNRARLLYELQETDAELASKGEALKRLTEDIEHSKKLAQAEADLKAAKDSLAGLVKQQRDEESEIEAMRGRARPMEKKLYSGSVGNPKDLVSLKQDLDQLRGRVKQKEDRVLDVMAQVEEAGEKVAVQEKSFSTFQKSWEQEKRGLLADKKKLEDRLAEAARQRENLLATVTPADLKLYQLLRAGKRTAVARIEQGRCQGCRLTLPLNVLQRVRQPDALVQCSSCERILYLEG